MSQLNLTNMDSRQLKALYEHEKDALQKNLLSGMSWEKTSALRKKTAELSRLLYDRLNQRNDHPAENKMREDE